MDRFIDALRTHAGTLVRTLGQARFATVTSYDPSTHAARVLWQPEGIASGWLPVLTQATGGGWGVVYPLNPGDQVFVMAQEGDSQHSVIIGSAFSSVNRPPAMPDNEMWIRHQSGACLRLRPDGSVLIEGDLHVGGQIFDGVGSLSRLRHNYNAHTHETAYGTRTRPTDQSDG